MAITPSIGAIRWGIESTYNTAGTPIQSFGPDAEVTGLMLDNNTLPLRDLGERTIGGYAFGTNKSGYSVSCVLANPWLLRTIFALDTSARTMAGTTANNNRVYTYKWRTDPGIKGFTTELRLDTSETAGNNDVRVRLVGCLATRWNISSQVDQYVRQSIDVVSGKVLVDKEEYADFPAINNEPTFPFTFRHGQVTVGGSRLTEVQSIDLSVDTGQTLRYGHGSLDSLSALAGPVDITANITTSLDDATFFNAVNGRSAVNVVLKFDNGIDSTSTTNGQDHVSIQLTLNNLRVTKTSVDIKKVDAVEDTFTIQATDARVVIVHKFKDDASGAEVQL